MVRMSQTSSNRAVMPSRSRMRRGMIAAAIGEDKAPARQVFRSPPPGLHPAPGRQVDVMDIVQIVVRRRAMLAHQPVQGGAIAAIEFFLPRIGRLARQLEEGHDIVGHAAFDLARRCRCRRSTAYCPGRKSSFSHDGNRAENQAASLRLTLSGPVFHDVWRFPWAPEHGVGRASRASTVNGRPPCLFKRLLKRRAQNGGWNGRNARDAWTRHLPPAAASAGP